MAGIANTLNQTFDGQIASLTQLQQINRARGRSIPVMPYCFSTAAALSAQGQLDILDHAKIAHMSPEPGHLRLVVALRKVPIIDLKCALEKQAEPPLQHYWCGTPVPKIMAWPPLTRLAPTATTRHKRQLSQLLFAGNGV